MDSVEEIRAKLSIEDVVGQYVQLKRSGRNMKACCPFHQEKTPSFVVSPDKGMAYCFGCRKGGDIFAFVQEVENVDFPEALRILAEKAGVELKRQSFSPQSKERKQVVLGLIEEAQRFFAQELGKNQDAQDYLTRRGYERKLQAQLGLGLAPDSFHQLCQFLENKGFKAQDILDAGLAAQKQVGDAHIYDRFRNRIIFPIHDPQGRLVAFGGRALASDDPAKYLNSPETKYYHKGHTLYCFHLAKQAMREQDQALIVEGYFDALTCQSKGYPQAVASLGTALTEEQVRLIGRFTKNLVFAFDADASGQAAASRSIEIAQRLGYNVSILTIPSGKDPDEALRTVPNEWEQALKQAVPAVDYEINKALKSHDAGTIQGKKAIADILLPIVNRLPNALEQEHYLKKIAFELTTSLGSLYEQFRKQKPLQPRASTPPGPQIKHQQVKSSRFDYLLALVLFLPELKTTFFERIRPEYLETVDEKNLYKYLSESYNQSDIRGEEVQESDQEARRLQFLELFGEETYSDFNREKAQEELESLIASVRKDYKRRQISRLKVDLARNPHDAALLKELQDLLSDQF